VRILVVHNRYLYRGGEAAAYEAECRMLEDRGWIVDRFEEDNRRVEELGRLRTAGRAVWSMESAQAMRQRLCDHRYNLIHVHNFFPLVSPSVHHVAFNAGLPVVQTLHNYRLFCLNPTPYRSGRVCSDCLGRSVPWPGVMHACYRGDRRASAAVAAMVTAHRMLGTWRRKVNVFIALTDFARQRFIAGGFPADRLMIKPNLVRVGRDSPKRTRDDFVLFVGRLTQAKGVRTLLAAWRGMPEPPPLVIAGDGELASEVADAASSPRIRWLGHRSPAEVHELMASCRLLVVPAESWENGSMVVMEAAASATPTVASDMGAVGEIAGQEIGAVTVPAGDPGALAEAVGDLYRDRQRLERLADEARSNYEKRFSVGANYHLLMQVYGRALGRRPEGLSAR
jgi:glycosyltransferase involved in cell wall biosynthesis